ncbi:dienelactone hydrolase family protein [Paludisphaera borealis]|uniref:Phosphoribosyl transferase n=1 Tax=Paludisphaera borealis TaxID=1387353 RepID=A0A1U7CNM9_9BACT|nr:dienelactone hydrolase family protein [Paludisphaera borealis]APW60542.1 Putative phosphoribosyl transferase [Paludisphaera borealis]
MSPGMNAERAGQEVRIPTFEMLMSGTLVLPRGASRVILFAHGSGSGRFSSRNQFVAASLQRARLGTLLIDLLAEDEAKDLRKVFDIELLAARLLTAAQWLAREPATRGLRLGFLGASTGAAAALIAAARRPELAGAVVSRGGRPDLARGDLPDVTVPTLLIVGSLDEDVLELNRQAPALLRSPRELVVVPGATHLFPEPGTLEEVARLAERWFLQHLERDSQLSRDRPATAAE